MGAHIVDNKLEISTETTTFCFDSPTNDDNNFNYEIYSIRKRNELLA